MFFQGGISTVLGVSVLTFVDSYMIKVFFKTVFLVILFGVAHALIFLPVLLSTVMPYYNMLITSRKWAAKLSPADHVAPNDHNNNW